MWNAAEMIEAFDATVPSLASLASDTQKVSWWNQGQARFLKPCTVDLTWNESDRSIALPADFISVDKLTVGSGVTPQPWRAFGKTLVLDDPEGANEDGSARLYYWGEFPTLAAEAWWNGAIGFWPLDDADASAPLFRNLGSSPGDFTTVDLGEAQLDRQAVDRGSAGKALDFQNPINDYPSLNPISDAGRSAARIAGYPSTFLGRLPFSVEFWTKVPSGGGPTFGTDDTYWGIIGHLTSFGEGNSGWGVFLRHDGRVVLQRNDAARAADEAASTGSIVDGNWHHVACVYDGNAMTVYVDGVAGVSVASVKNCAGSGSFIYLGLQELDFAVSPVEAYYRAPLDDVAIWNRALTPAEIAAHTAADPNVLVGSAQASEMTTAQDYAALSFALSRFYRRMAANRFYYKRYATLLGESAVSARALGREADRHYQDFLDGQEDTHLHLLAPAFHYESE